MKKTFGFILVCFILILLILFSMSGCGATGYGEDVAAKDKNIASDFVNIAGEDNLYYCRDTYVVYWIGSFYQGNIVADDYVTSFMTPYYAPNGRPYIYDKITRKIIEIQE